MNVLIQKNKPVDLYAATGIALENGLKISSNSQYPIRLAHDKDGIENDYITLPPYKSATNSGGSRFAFCYSDSVINVKEVA